MESQLLGSLASLGVGGLIAALVLIWKRADDKAHAKILETMFARMEQRDKSALEIIQGNTTAVTTLQATVAGLSALTKLNERLDELEGGRSHRRPDND